MSAIGAPRAKSATDKAQDVMYQAWDQAEPRKRIALANKALTISPLCADAYVLLAEEKAKCHSASNFDADSHRNSRSRQKKAA